MQPDHGSMWWYLLLQRFPLLPSGTSDLVPPPAIGDRKSYAAAVNDFASSIWHLAMTFATDFEVQLNG